GRNQARRDVVLPCWASCGKAHCPGRGADLAVVAAGEEATEACEHERHSEGRSGEVGEAGERQAMETTRRGDGRGAGEVAPERGHARPAQADSTAGEQLPDGVD